MVRTNKSASASGGRRAGFTLVESLLAAVVLAVAAVSIAEAITVAQTHAYEAAHMRRAIRLGEELIERALALPYSDPDGLSNPGPEPGEIAIGAFDNADDWHGYSESGDTLLDVVGNPYPADYAGFTRSVSAAYANQSAGAMGTVIGLHIVVTVTDARGVTWTLIRFISDPNP